MGSCVYPSRLFADRLDGDGANTTAGVQIDAIGGRVEIRRHIDIPLAPVIPRNADIAQPGAALDAYGYPVRNADGHVADVAADPRLYVPLARQCQCGVSDTRCQKRVTITRG